MAFTTSGILILGILLGAAADAQTPPVPSTLTVTAATKGRVDLSWTGSAGSFVVERRTLAGTFRPVLTGSGTVAADTQIDGMETYVYRVRGSSATGNSDPSNEVTVGPPPVGAALAVPLPANLAANEEYDPSWFGLYADMKLDTNGDPAILYFVLDPNMTGANEESEVRFVSWNRAAYRWNPEAKVAVVGDIGGFRVPLSLAQDASNGMWAAAVEDYNHESVRVLLSTNGQQWRQIYETTGKANDQFVAAPGIALSNGILHLSYNLDFEGTRYLTGRYTDAPSTWKDIAVTPPAGTDRGDANVSTAIALDTKGVPGIAFWVSDGDYNRVVAFWKPGLPVAIKVADTQGLQSDFVDIRMVYQGDNPRILFEANRDENLEYEYDWVVRSDDGGGTWTNPVYIPRDGGHHSLDAPFDIAVSTDGHGVVAANRNSGQGDDVCSGIKFSRSSDLSNWQTCSVSSGRDGDEFSNGGSLRLQFAPNGKVYMLWQQAYANSLGRGVMFWREQ